MLSNLEVETQTIIFTNIKSNAHKLHEYLLSKDHKAALLMGGGEITPEDRDLNIMKFKNGDFQILVTTDVLARGLDIRNVGLVINLDIPLIVGSNNEGVNVDTYLNRISKKGRFSEVGIVLNLLSRPMEASYIAKLENYCKTKIEEFQDMKQLEKLKLRR